MDYTKYYEKNKDEIIKHTMELIAIPSVLKENEVVDGKTYRFGYANKVALDYIVNLGNQLGFKTKNVEDVCAHVEYGEGEEIFAVLCHLDVVLAVGDWKNPPFSPVIEDGKIFGRGSIDDKGPAVCALYALKTIKDLGIKLKRRIRVIFGSDEETGSRGLIRYLELEEMPTMGISPDADFPVIYGEKGICSIDFVCKNDSKIKAKGGVRYNVVAPSVIVEKNDKVVLNDLPLLEGMYCIFGKSAHAMEPNNGINAIKIFASKMKDVVDDNLINFINDNLMNTRLKDMGLDIVDDEMGELTMNMGILEYSDIKKLGINIRYPKNLDFDSFMKKMKEIASKYGLEAKLVSNTKPHYVNPKSDFIKVLYDSYNKYTNDNARMKTIGGGTYAREIKNAVAYGVNFPGEVEMAHEVDEYASIDSLMKAGTIITDAIINLNKSE